MTSERWHRLEQLYQKALALPAEDRTAFLADACKSDPALRQEVADLLGAPGDTLDRPAWEYAPGPVADHGYLNPDAAVGPYRIDRLLGAGGMGEVYAAFDMRLRRKVAVKVLPPEFRRDPERKQRFDREAHIISLFNHPHICTIHDVGSDTGLDYLVMEYLDGDTLAARLAKGRLNAKDVLRYAMEIASALAYAHREGVTHRDLKPANVMLTKGGTKLLDFGLASSVATGSVHDDLTQTGVIIGTPQYMAPEQVEGRKADMRTDIFAFGAVVYEMATGHRAFEGNSRAAVMSAILREEPPLLSSVNASVPLRLAQIVQTCLAKDPDARWQSMHDVQLQLDSISGAEVDGSDAHTQRWRNWMHLAAVLGALILVATGYGLYRFLSVEERPKTLQLQIAAPDATTFADEAPAISPDGQTILFAAASPGEPWRLWIRRLDSVGATPLPGTESALYGFWSPDSRAVGFVSDGNLRKIEITTRAISTICPAGNGTEATWNRAGVILAANGSTVPASLYRVSDSGGEPVAILADLRAEKMWPSFLPDGKHFLFALRDQSHPNKNGVYVGSLDTDEIRSIIPGALRAAFVAPKYLVFLRGNKILAQTFDPTKLALSGDPVIVADHVFASPTGHQIGGGFSVSNTGVLSYRMGQPLERQMVWYNRAGAAGATLGDAGQYSQIVLSPDTKRVLVQRRDPATDLSNLWLLDVATTVFSRLTSGTNDYDIVWSPDSRSIFFGSDRSGFRDIYRRDIEAASDRLILASPERKVPESWVPAGSVLYTVDDGRKIFETPISGGKPRLLLSDSTMRDEPHVSPEGSMIAWTSPESGAWQVYVASFPDFGNKRQVSSHSGGQPQWRGDGKELFYLSTDGMMAVDVIRREQIETSAPRRLFKPHLRPYPTRDEYSVTPDGKRFLVLEQIEQTPKPIEVVLNWPTLLSPGRAADHR